MSRVFHFGLAILFLASLVACHSGKAKEEQLLNEAKQVEEQNQLLLAEISERWAGLVQKRNAINIQGRALRPEETAFVEKVDRLQGELPVGLAQGSPGSLAPAPAPDPTVKARLVRARQRHDQLQVLLERMKALDEAN